MGEKESPFRATSGIDAPAAFVNGEPAETLPVSDRGFHYGDGLFETVAVRDNRLEFWDRHMARLARGCAHLGLPAPDPGDLSHDAELLCRGQRACNGVEKGIVKIILTRGSGGRGYRTPEEVGPSRVVSFHPWPDYPESNIREGVRVRFCELKLGRQPALAGIKHLNRLENVLARREWDDPDIAEGLLGDEGGLVVEGTMSNLFCVEGGCLRTPDLSRCGVAGIVRAVVLEIAEEQGIPCQVLDIPAAEVSAAEELFLTNSVIGIWPVRALGAAAFKVGPVTRTLMERLEERRRAETT